MAGATAQDEYTRLVICFDIRLCIAGCDLKTRKSRWYRNWLGAIKADDTTVTVMNLFGHLVPLVSDFSDFSGEVCSIHPRGWPVQRPGQAAVEIVSRQR